MPTAGTGRVGTGPEGRRVQGLAARIRKGRVRKGRIRKGRVRTDPDPAGTGRDAGWHRKGPDTRPLTRCPSGAARLVPGSSVPGPTVPVVFAMLATPGCLPILAVPVHSREGARQCRTAPLRVHTAPDLDHTVRPRARTARAPGRGDPHHTGQAAGIRQPAGTGRAGTGPRRGPAAIRPGAWFRDHTGRVGAGLIVGAGPALADPGDGSPGRGREHPSQVGKHTVREPPCTALARQGAALALGHMAAEAGRTGQGQARRGNRQRVHRRCLDEAELRVRPGRDCLVLACPSLTCLVLGPGARGCRGRRAGSAPRARPEHVDQDGPMTAAVGEPKGRSVNSAAPPDGHAPLRAARTRRAAGHPLASAGVRNRAGYRWGAATGGRTGPHRRAPGAVGGNRAGARRTVPAGYAADSAACRPDGGRRRTPGSRDRPDRPARLGTLRRRACRPGSRRIAGMG